MVVATSRLFEAAENENVYARKYTYTENGALTLKSSGTALLDMFSRMGAMRKSSTTEILKLFNAAFNEADSLAIVCAFYLRDIRGGQGERNIFRVILNALAKKNNGKEYISKIIPFVPEYGRWDDLFALKGTTSYSLALAFMWEQIIEDLKVARNAQKTDEFKSISLAAKWMPSEKAGKKSRVLYEDLLKVSNLSKKAYRRVMTFLRTYLNVVEQKMCDQNWTDINYETVPSRAAKIYKKAFAKHDPKGYSNYIASLQKGTAKINSATLYPYELVKEAFYSNNPITEAQWKALPDYTGEHLRNALVMADTSGSMYGDPLNVALSIALYLAERNQNSVWQNKFITFSNQPTFYNIDPSLSLHDKITSMSRANWNMNTNLTAAFRKILDLAIKNNLTQEDMPEILYIVSDMEFDQADRVGKTNLQVIDEMYTNAGYVRPKIAYWNVDSRNQQSPAGYDEQGVALFSGLSPSIFLNILSGKNITPVEVMMSRLEDKRYQPLISALFG